MFLPKTILTSTVIKMTQLQYSQPLTLYFKSPFLLLFPCLPFFPATHTQSVLVVIQCTTVSTNHMKNKLNPLGIKVGDFIFFFLSKAQSSSKLPKILKQWKERISLPLTLLPCLMWTGSDLAQHPCRFHRGGLFMAARRQVNLSASFTSYLPSSLHGIYTSRS